MGRAAQVAFAVAFITVYIARIFTGTYVGDLKLLESQTSNDLINTFVERHSQKTYEGLMEGEKQPAAGYSASYS